MPPYAGLRTMCKVDFIKCPGMTHFTFYHHVSRQRALETHRFAHLHTVHAVGQKASILFGMQVIIQARGIWLHTFQLPHPSKNAAAVQVCTISV